MKNTLVSFALFVVAFVGGYIVISYYFADEENQNNQTPPENTPVEELNFVYPEELNTDYIEVVDWPPMSQVVDEPYSCIEAGNETDRAGRTEEQMINDNQYCVTILTEGAAGSVYRQYAYAFAHHDQTIYLTFSLRYPQCRNYEEEQRNACENEQTSFDQGILIDEVASATLAE